jgi:Na+/H+-dicarboxylate symporter
LSAPVRILLALVLGLSVGIASVATGGAWVEQAINIAEPIGGMWLNALRMTIVPLVVSLLVVGIAATAAAARASKLAARSMILFVSILWIATIIAAVLTPLLLNLFPLPEESAASLRAALSTSEPVGDAPSFADFLKSIVPSNAIAAARRGRNPPADHASPWSSAFASPRCPRTQREPAGRLLPRGLPTRCWW